MVLITKAPDTEEKLGILSRDSRFDLACSCGTREDEHRRRSAQNTWIYPVSLPSGGTTYLFKTLLSNECVNNCMYCPLRSGGAERHCSLSPEEAARAFLSYYRARRVSGLFLSSGVKDSPDETMERINRAALLLRRTQFRGYIHLKVIPGASEAAIRQSLSLASGVSLNIESPGEESFKSLSTTKNYLRDIVRPIELISRLTQRGARHEGVKVTTQFVVGASTETDGQIIGASWKLYKELGLSRVYFSAYQRMTPEPGASAEKNGERLTREHRLYQVDWLIRRYGFRADEIPLDGKGNLSLTVDPKELWAQRHPEFFPVDLNRDEAWRLLRVPGLGQVTVGRIMALRERGVRLRSIEQAGKVNKGAAKAARYVRF